MNWSLQASQQWAWCTKLELLTAPPTEVEHNIILKPSCQPFEILFSYFPKLLLRIELPTCEKLFIVPTILVYYYKYTTQDLLKLLRKSNSQFVQNCLLFLTIWLLLQIHNSRFTEIVENQIVYCPDHFGYNYF